MMTRVVCPALVALCLLTQSPALAQRAGAAPKKGVSTNAAPATIPGAPQTTGEPEGVEAVVALLQANTKESVILRVIAAENKPRRLKISDILKLQQSGASERIIEALADPSVAVQDAVKEPAAPAVPITVPNAPPNDRPMPVTPAPLEAVSPPTAPQPATAPTSESATPRRTTMFDRLGGRLKNTVKRTADNTLGNAEKTAGKAIDSTEASATRAVDRSAAAAERGVASAETSVNSRVDKAVGAADEKSKVPGTPK